MIIIYISLIIMFFVFYLFFRINNIQKEIDQTWSIKKWGIIENFLKTAIEQDIADKKRIQEQQTKERFLKREIWRKKENIKKVLTIH